MKFPYFKKQLSLIPYGEKLSIGATPDFALEVTDPSGLVYEILCNCNGSNTIEDIYIKIKHKYKDLRIEEVTEIIDSLSSYPLILEDYATTIESSLTPREIERHSRTMNFLSNFDYLGTEKVNYMKKIINSNVLIIGLGGVGSSLAMNLAALGVQRLYGVDFDKVDLSNLNRQLLYSESDVGSLKSEAAKEKLDKFDSSIQFTTFQLEITCTEDVERLIKEFNIDFVFCAADQPSIWIYKWINEACHNTQTAWIYGGNSEASSYFQTIIPNETSCFNCRELNLKQFSAEGYFKYSEVKKHGYATQNNCLAATSSCITSFMIFDFIRYITKFESPRVVNQLFTLDYRDYTISYLPVEKNQMCNCQE
ncbi:TPA: ThiF family adenylyltransferase [Streptococcus suis]|nr:ThiF family adenylyltransferase [Streptococcus suis]HEM3724320.1 ThiF family adenylyltransferase [Streptococcus suis]